MKISVIISVYNTEKYIEKCVDSILDQTYKEIEIILVNDGSKDKSREILKKYEKNSKVKIIDNKKNMGLSYSRNIALKESTGKYIGYIDSDDFVDKDYYEKLMNSIKKEKSEIAVCDMNLYYEESGKNQIVPACDGAPTKINFINNGLAASACNKLFKRELLEKYPFAEGKVNEDIAVVIPALVNAKKISYTKNIYYYYVQRNTSIQNSAFSIKRFDIFAGIDTTLERIKGCKDYENIKDALIFNQIIVLLIYKFPEIEDKKERTYFIKEYSKRVKKYNIRQNHYFWQFLSGMNSKNLIYYKLLFKFTCEGKAKWASNIISAVLTYKKYFRKNVIPKLNLEDLVKIAQKNSKRKQNLKISVVIPNYNYENFLIERLYSILSQEVKIYELIILDDCSKDNSIERIEELAAAIEPFVNVKKVYNKENSGSAFKQWEKGFKESTGDYVWIAEADDYCNKKMLKNLIKPLKKEENIRISYCDTAFIDKVGKIIMPSVKKEIDIMKTGHWDNDYINNGKEELKNYTYLNCTIANVSSTLIKKDNYQEFFKESSKYKQAGDWLFYANVMDLGNIAYTNKTLNYYRIHGNNVSSVTKKEAHIEEIKQIHEFFEKKFGLNKKQKKEIEKRYKVLKEAWNLEK